MSPQDELTPAQIAGRLTAALATINNLWADTLEPTRGAPGLGSAGSKEAPTPIPTHILDLRRDTELTLTGWALVTIEDRQLHYGPRSNDAPGLCEFLNRHTEWLSLHDAAADILAEIQKAADRITAATRPQRRDWVNLGACPLEVDSDEGPATCGGQVRAKTEPGGTVTCQRCGTEGALTWWERIIMPDASRLVTAAELPEFVRQQFGKAIKTPTVRKWIERGVITAAGTDDKGRTLYDKGAVAYALARRDMMSA
jgi:hypothetical protein